jgi:hypothetical protein
MEGEFSESLEEEYPLSENLSNAGNLPRPKVLFEGPETYIS